MYCDLKRGKGSLGGVVLLAVTNKKVSGFDLASVVTCYLRKGSGGPCVTTDTVL